MTDETMPRVVVVTGAGGGIGTATCRRLSAEGWAIVAADLRDDSFDALRELPGVARRVSGDITDSGFVDEVARIAEELGTLTGWVNTVGALSEKPLHLLDDAAIAGQLSTNLLTTVYGCRAAIRSFLRTATPGSIVNIGSIHGAQPFDALPLYAASKGAIESLTRQLCVEYGGLGIRINTVAPGAVNTRMTTGSDPERVEDVLRVAADLSPMNRVSSADEVASVINFLLSAEAVGFNGTVVRVDNGMAATGRNR